MKHLWMGPIDEAFVTASLKTWEPNNCQFLERLNLSVLRTGMCWSRGTESHTYLNLFPRKFLFSLVRSSYSEVRHSFSCSKLPVCGIRRFNRRSEHKSHHWATYNTASLQLEFSPILISLLHFPCGISLSPWLSIFQSSHALEQ